MPAGLEIRDWGGTGWLGVVPFRMTASWRYLPLAPLFPTFPELNVRTYVEKDGKPGIWFLSLDAESLPAVLFARWAYNLPYHQASMSMSTEGDWTCLRSARETQSGPVRFSGRYRPVSASFEAPSGSIDAFLAENYRMYTQDRSGRLHSLEVRHAPWPLHRAVAELDCGSLATALGMDLGGPPAHLHFSPGVEVVSCPLERV